MARNILSRGLKAARISQFALWYDRQSWAQRAAWFAALVIITGAIAWSTGTNPLPYVAGATAASVVLHFLFRIQGAFPVAIVWFFNLVAIPWASMAYSATQNTALDQYAGFVLSVAALLVSSILWHVLAHKHSRGRLWVTLALVFFVQAVGVYWLGLVTGWMASGFFALVLGGGALWLRVKYARPKAQTTLPDAMPSQRQKAVQSILSNNQLKVLVQDEEANSVLAASKRGLILFHIHNTPTPLTTNKGTLQYQGSNLDAFAARHIAKAAELGKKYDAKIHTVILTKDSGLSRAPLRVDVLTTEKRLVGTVHYADYGHLNELIDLMTTTSVTPAQIEQIRTDYHVTVPA